MLNPRDAEGGLSLRLPALYVPGVGPPLAGAVRWPHAAHPAAIVLALQETDP